MSDEDFDTPEKSSHLLDSLSEFAETDTEPGLKYLRRRQALENAIENDRRYLNKLSSRQPSAEFEETTKYYQIYIAEFDNLISSAESLITRVENGAITSDGLKKLQTLWKQSMIVTRN
jgi:hypothetical protein